MQVVIEIDDDELQQEVKKMIAKNIVDNYRSVEYGPYKKTISEVIKETVYSNKDILIEKCVDKAASELTKKAFPKLIDKMMCDSGNK